MANKQGNYMRVKIQFEARLPVTFKIKKNYIIAICPMLDVMSQGSNKEEAKKNLTEALSLFFISCYEHGTLDEILKGCGFKFLKISPNEEIESEGELIDVQIPFFAPIKKDSVECRA